MKEKNAYHEGENISIIFKTTLLTN